MKKDTYQPEEKYMRRALALAEKAAAMGEVPVGAVIVHVPTGTIIGEGWNLRENRKSPLAHAELMAIEQASQCLGGWRLVDSAMYVTLEPCPMCCGGILHARLDHLIFGAYDQKSGSVCSVQKMFALPYNYAPEIVGGFLEEPCRALMQDFFQRLREQRKQNGGQRWHKGLSQAAQRALAQAERQQQPDASVSVPED